VKLIGTSGPPLQLTGGPASDFNPVWSPDGRFIAFLRYIHQESVAILLIPALGGPERKIVETRLGSISEPMVGGPYLAWSPDGNFLVISDKDSLKETPALFVVAIDTGKKRRLTSPPSEVSNVVRGIPIQPSPPTGELWHLSGVATSAQPGCDRPRKVYVPTLIGRPRRMSGL
jgi:Tol biopolymer transport system component